MADPLIETESNPAPTHTHAGRFAGREGVSIRYAVFDTCIRPRRGTVILLQGRNETIEKYFETAADLAARGFQTAMFDLRGQGGSQRLLSDPWRGHVASFADYVDDLDGFFQHVVLPDCRPPYYLLGHSTGALVALLAAPTMRNRIERQILCAPLLRLSDQYPPHWLIGVVSSLLSSFGLGAISVAGRGPLPDFRPFVENRLTSDERRYSRNMEICQAAPHLFLGNPTASWLDAFHRASEHVQRTEFIARIHLPTLIIAGTADQIVSYRAIEAFAARLRSGSLLIIEGAHHEILQEADRYREQFLAAFDAFIPGEAAFATPHDNSCRPPDRQGEYRSRIE